MATVRKRAWTYKGETKTAWVVAYTDMKGKRRQKTFEQKKTADKYRLKVETEIEKGTHLAQSQEVTIGELCEAYVRHCEDRVADGRIGKTYNRRVRTTVFVAVIPSLGKRKLSELKLSDIEQFYHELCLTRCPVYAKQQIEEFKRIEAFGRKRGMTASVIISEGLKELRGVVAEPVRSFTRDEVLSLLQTAAIRPHRAHYRTHFLTNIAVHTAAFCGLRCGEIMGLQPGNIDCDAAMIRVRNNLSIHDGLKVPKTKSGVRDVPMPRHLAEMYRAWLKDHAVPNKLGLLFCSSWGTPIYPNSFSGNMWRVLIRRSGLVGEGRPLHFHALRHFAASWMIENGLPITDTASLLGHAKFDMTLRVYAHPVVGGHRRQDVIESMSTKLLGPPSFIPKEVVSISQNAVKEEGPIAPAAIPSTPEVERRKSRDAYFIRRNAKRRQKRADEAATKASTRQECDIAG
ncbi:MAG: site-specific integrase [Hyphomicrobiales bacterium]|nr:site-specific integrase [Hyphomicrobiales bacterium]